MSAKTLTAIRTITGRIRSIIFYEMVVMGLSTVGLVFLIIAIVKKQIRFESGIIPPAKEKLFMNSVCTVGAAALVTVYVIYFVISIIPVN